MLSQNHHFEASSGAETRPNAHFEGLRDDAHGTVGEDWGVATMAMQARSRKISVSSVSANARAFAAFAVLTLALLATVFPASAGAAGWFSIHCGFSHRALDDPIVKFGQPGASHEHAFTANTTTNAFSTYTSMRDGATTCHFSGDTAGYWMPSLRAPDGTVLKLRTFTAYYRALPAGGTFEKIPADLRIVAGYPTVATGTDKVLGYSCLDSEPLNPTPIDCTGHAKLYIKAHIFFPNCWDGNTVDSPDHRSHMAYPVGTKCPADHPHKLPRLSLHFTFDRTNCVGCYVSSDPQNGVTDGRSLHADFWNTWDQTQLDALVQRCIIGNVVCNEQTN